MLACAGHSQYSHARWRSIRGVAYRYPGQFCLILLLLGRLILLSQMLDATLSRPPSPRSFIARDRTVSSTSSSPSFTGRIVIPSTQADILGHWLMAPGRPALADEKDSITPEREFTLFDPVGGLSSTLTMTDMRIYSSLSPLELHARAAELCRVILTRDPTMHAQFGHRECLFLGHRASYD